MAQLAKLSRTERNKIEPRLQLWLDGKAEEIAGVPRPEPPHRPAMRVSVRFKDPVLRVDLGRLKKLGVEAEEGSADAFGKVTRDNLAALAKEQNVMSIAPVHLLMPFGG